MNGVPTPATTGPFTAVTSSGTSKTFTMSSSGTFPYFCENHASLGMYGVVYVD